MSTTTYVVGIDVAKAQLDMALRPTGERWAVANDEAGMAALVARLQALLPTLIVLEATGGYQRAVVAALAAAGLPVAVVNPRQARALPRRPDSWPRRMPSTPARGPMSPRRCGRPPGPWRTHKPTNSVPCWRGAGNG
jgi:transposase